jgi:beta-glucanase (GH16 family)
MFDFRSTLTRLMLGATMALGLTMGNSALADANAPLVPGKWKKVFSDEFDGSDLNLDKWTTCYWWNENGCTNLGNEELEWYQPENVRVAKGSLILQAKPQTVVGYKGKPFSYTSGMVTTGRDYSELPRRPRFEFTHGLIEIRAKLPAGKGIWPALWLLPSTRESRPEIDIIEVLGDNPNLFHMHVHYIDSHGKKISVGQTVRTVDLTKDWHVYGLQWTSKTVVWYLDGKEIWRWADKANVPREPLYLLMNLAVGGKWPGAPNASTRFPSEFLIDYVRIWQGVDG